MFLWKELTWASLFSWFPQNLQDPKTFAFSAECKVQEFLPKLEATFYEKITELKTTILTSNNERFNCIICGRLATHQ